MEPECSVPCLQGPPPGAPILTQFPGPV